MGVKCKKSGFGNVFASAAEKDGSQAAEKCGCGRCGKRKIGQTTDNVRSMNGL